MRKKKYWSFFAIAYVSSARSHKALSSENVRLNAQEKCCQRCTGAKLYVNEIWYKNKFSIFQRRAHSKIYTTERCFTHAFNRWMHILAYQHDVIFERKHLSVIPDVIMSWWVIVGWRSMIYDRGTRSTVTLDRLSSRSWRYPKRCAAVIRKRCIIINNSWQLRVIMLMTLAFSFFIRLQWGTQRRIAPWKNVTMDSQTGWEKNLYWECVSRLSAKRWTRTRPESERRTWALYIKILITFSHRTKRTCRRTKSYKTITYPATAIAAAVIDKDSL